MTVEEMIGHLENPNWDPYSREWYQDDDTLKSIIAALRAGQAMRDSIVIANITGTPVQINGPAAKAAEAWDAAIKEDV